MEDSRLYARWLDEDSNENLSQCMGPYACVHTEHEVLTCRQEARAESILSHCNQESLKISDERVI